MALNDNDRRDEAIRKLSQADRLLLEVWQMTTHGGSGGAAAASVTTR